LSRERVDAGGASERKLERERTQHEDEYCRALTRAARRRRRVEVA
jgi:hypothetical protein